MPVRVALSPKAEAYPRVYWIEITTRIKDVRFPHADVRPSPKAPVFSRRAVLARRVLSGVRGTAVPETRNRLLRRSAGGMDVSTRAIDWMFDGSWMLRDRRTRSMTRDQARKRIRSDYLELTGLKLTVPQAARLWSLELDGAAIVLDELVARGFLMCCDGVYMRR